jgi:hypothetical protein
MLKIILIILIFLPGGLIIESTFSGQCKSLVISEIPGTGGTTDDDSVNHCMWDGDDIITDRAPDCSILSCLITDFVPPCSGQLPAGLPVSVWQPPKMMV